MSPALRARSKVRYVAHMLIPPQLMSDEQGAATGSRLGTSGWPIWGRVRLVRQDQSGIFEWDETSIVARAPAKTKVGLVIDGEEIVGRQRQLDDDYLVRDGHLRGTERPTQAILAEFLALGSEPSATAVLAFAQRHGLLGLALTPRSRAASFAGWLPQLGTLLAPTLGYRHTPAVANEPLRLWHRVAREIAAVADIAARLRSDKRVGRTAWSPLAETIRFPLKADEVSASGHPKDDAIAAGLGTWLHGLDADKPDDQRTALMAVVSGWFATGAVTPGIEWNAGSEPPSVSLWVSTLFGGIVLELAVAVVGSAGIVLCSNCSLPFVPGRRPTARQLDGEVGIYCSNCRAAGVPVNKAAARWRSRNRGYFAKRRAGLAAADHSSAD